MSALARVGRWYSERRVVHINVNIIASVAASTAVTAALVGQLARHVEGVAALTVATAVLDAVVEALIFVGLHRLASGRRFAGQARAFLADAALLQVHRVVLSPLFYLLSMGTQAALLSAGVRPAVTVWVAYMGAVVVTRAVHTAWGLRTGLFD